MCVGFNRYVCFVTKQQAVGPGSTGSPGATSQPQSLGTAVDPHTIQGLAFCVDRQCAPVDVYVRRRCTGPAGQRCTIGPAPMPKPQDLLIQCTICKPMEALLCLLRISRSSH